MKRILLSIAALAMFGAAGAGHAVADDDDNRYRYYPPSGYQLPLQGRVDFYIGPRGEVYIDGSAVPFRQYYGQAPGYPMPGVPYVYNGSGYAPFPYQYAPGRGYQRYGRPNYYEYDWPRGYRNYRHWRGGDDDDDDDEDWGYRSYRHWRGGDDDDDD